MPKRSIPDIDWSGLVTLVSPPIEAAYIATGESSWAQLGADGTFNQLNERAAAYSGERAAELVGMKYDEAGNLVPNPDAEWAITDTTRDDIRDLVEQAFTDGMSPDELSTAIEDLIDDPDRADMIARTELADAQSEADLDAAKESGVVTGKYWLLGENPCSVCQDNADAGTIDLDEEFPSGDDGPAAHVGCECALGFAVDGEDE
jgi:hypothetical protein